MDSLSPFPLNFGKTSRVTSSRVTLKNYAKNSQICLFLMENRHKNRL